MDKFCLSTQILTGSWVCRQLDEVDEVDRQNLAINGQGGSVQSGDEKIKSYEHEQRRRGILREPVLFDLTCSLFRSLCLYMTSYIGQIPSPTQRQIHNDLFLLSTGSL